MQVARKSVVSVLLASLLVITAAPALADDYDPQRSGHPVRVAAYLLHPVGVILDVLIFRPAHWMVSQNESVARFFGHEPYTE